MRVSEITEADLTDDIIDRILFENLNDTGEDVDCIIVLGSIKAAKYRVPVAANAYNTGRANKVMLCGGALREFAEGKMMEAEHMKNKALQLGIPETDIILENISQNEIIPCPADDENTGRDNWMNTPEGIERARGEVLNTECKSNGNRETACNL